MWYIVALAACVAGDQLLKWWVVSLSLIHI